MQDSSSHTFSAIRQLTKQQLGQFHKVRTKKSYVLGQHELYVRNKQKYIAKQLPAGQKFISTRTQNATIFYYNNSHSNNLYLFPLLGQPLNGVTLHRPGQKEIQQWLQRCGSVQNGLWQVLKTILKATQHNKVRDILPQCFRVSNGSVLYCYQSWMNDSRNVVKDNPHQLQNHFFSQSDLIQITEQDQGRGYTSRKDSIMFRIALFVLNLGTAQLKLRNYEYAGLCLKWTNIQERIKLFKNKYNQLNLGTFLERILIQKQTLTMEDLWKLIGGSKPAVVKDKLFKPNILKRNGTNKKNSKSKNLDVSISHISHFNDSFESNPNINNSVTNVLNDSTNIQHKRKLKLKVSDTKKKNKDKQTQMSQPFNIKKRLTQYNIDIVVKLSSYLGLDQYLPRNEYQTQILQSIEGVDIKSNWVRKTYPNGSLYFGSIQNDARHGKGLYLFESDDFYYGDWNNNKIHGYGSYIFKNGQCYQGSFQEGRKIGHGIYRYSDGRVFQGSWQNNMKIGMGTFKFPNEVIFIGIFNPKAVTTDGLFINTLNGKQWSGILEEYSWNQKDYEKNKENIQNKRKVNLKHCRVERFSEFTTREGNSYEGQCLQGKKHGFGIYRTEDEVYAGNWKDNLQDGQGTLTVNDKFSISGKWSQGFFCQYHNDLKQTE